MNSVRDSISYGLAVMFLVFTIQAVPGGTGAADYGILAGKVVDLNTGRPIEGALVTVQGTTISTMTGDNGKFKVELPPGKVSITIHIKEYYATCIQDIEVEEGKVTTYKCEMVPGDPEQNIFFSIGGITVIDERELIPKETETVHEISSAEIEHQLSTNLGDILDLIPGVERTDSPGLSEMSQVNIRGASMAENKSQALFGAKVIVDGVPMSNNANLQTGSGTSMSTSKSYAGTGLDLRTIPADNIENVEVVTGIPSVEYGDLTSGLVRVRTKMGRQPHRLKVKSNPDTKESNLSGGWVFDRHNTSVSYNLNYAYSQRNIRREGDEYSRYNAQVTVRNKLFDEKLEMMNKFYYHGVDDEQNFKKDDPLSVEQYNDDRTLIYGNNVDYNFDEDKKLELKSSIKYTKRDSYRQSLTGADTRVLTDETEPGTYPGLVDAGSYIYKIWTRGEEWSANAKLNFKYDYNLFDLDNSLLAGGEYSFDGNYGEGKIFNPLEPPYGSTGRRPRPFDDVPPLHTANLYLENELSGFWRMHPYSINLGLRYEMYTPDKLNLDGIFNDKGVVESKNGTFLNPRIRCRYELFDGTQLRASWGKSSKMPPLSSIAPGPDYIDIVEETPPDSTPLMSVYVFDYQDRNRYIKGYQSEKGELSLDQRIGPVGLTFTGFYSHSSDQLETKNEPVILKRYSYDEESYPDGEPEPIDTIYDTSSGGANAYENTGWHRNYGLEFMLRTKRIEKISTSFMISASYVKVTSGRDGVYMSSPRENEEIGHTIYPYYRDIDSWDRKMVVNYKADWFIKRVGMWVTFFLQQTLFDADQNAVEPYMYSTGYYDPIEGKRVSISQQESDELGLTREFEKTDLIIDKRPNDRLLFNINVSKSLGRGAEVSLFVHNVFDDAAWYQDIYGNWRSRNPDIFYGVEFSMILDELWRHSPEGIE